MRRALALVLLATPAAAAPHGPGCALSTRECLQVARELAVGAELDAEDARTFGLDMPPMPRTEMLIHRSAARFRARIPNLPVPVGNEVARIKLCNAMSESVRLGTLAELPLRCR